MLTSREEKIQKPSRQKKKKSQRDRTIVYNSITLIFFIQKEKYRLNS
jgi:hypothetical protein